MGSFRFKVRKFLLHDVLHADDAPHALALGTALAMLVAFLPLVGFQTVIAIGLAALFRVNKAVCVPIVWITNPSTMLPIYGACWKLGQWLTSSTTNGSADVILAKLEESHEALHFYQFSFWQEKFDLLLTMGTELWVGCVVVGVVLGAVSYVAAYRGVIAYRQHHRRRILKRDLFRAQRKAG